MIKIGINARFLANQYQYSGIGIYTKNIIETLAKNDTQNEYHIVCHEEQKETSIKNFALPKNFHFHHLSQAQKGSASFKKSFWEIRSLPKFFKKIQVNIVHSTYPNLAEYGTIKHIVTVHDIIPWILPGYTQNPLSKLYHLTSERRAKTADRIITVSEFSKREIIQHLRIAESKITVTHNAIDSNLKPSENFQLPSKNYLVYAGGYDKRKNVSQLIDVYQERIAPLHNMDLVLIGGKLHESKLYIDPSKIGNATKKGKIIAIGFVTEQEKATLIKNARAFVHLSLYEGFNIPLLETLALGTPALVSNIPVHHEVASDAAVYLDVTDESGMAKTIIETIENAKLLDELKHKGLIQAQKFSWQKNVEKLMSVYNQLPSP